MNARKYRPGERLAEIARAKRERETEELLKRTVELSIRQTSNALDLVGDYADLVKKMLDDQKKHVVAYAVLATVSTVILVHEIFRLFSS